MRGVVEASTCLERATRRSSSACYSPTVRASLAHLISELANGSCPSRALGGEQPLGASGGLFCAIRTDLACTVLWPSSTASCHDASWLLEAGQRVTEDTTGETPRRTELACPSHVAFADSSTPKREQLCLPLIWMGHAGRSRQVM